MNERTGKRKGVNQGKKRFSGSRQQHKSQRYKAIYGVEREKATSSLKKRMPKQEYVWTAGTKAKAVVEKASPDHSTRNQAKTKFRISRYIAHLYTTNNATLLPASV